MDESPSKSPSMSSLSDSVNVQEGRRESPPQEEPLNLSQKVSATSYSTSSSTEDEEELYFSDVSQSSRTVNVSGSPAYCSTGNPPTPTDERFDEYFEVEPPNVIDPHKLVEQTRAALRAFQSPEDLPPEESVIPDDMSQASGGVGMGGDSMNLMDEINMQRAIIQSLGLEVDAPLPETEEDIAHAPPHSPTSGQPRKRFRIPVDTALNPMEPIVEISTVDRAIMSILPQQPHPPHQPMQSPMLRPQSAPAASASVLAYASASASALMEATAPSAHAMEMALMPAQSTEGMTPMRLVSFQDPPADEGAPEQASQIAQMAQMAQMAQIAQMAQMAQPFVENPIPAHTGDATLAGGSGRRYTVPKQYLTLCFVLPWGNRHYVRELHADHTMKDLILFLQSYLQRYKDIDWQRDIVELKMANPIRNLSKLPLKTKLRDAKLGVCPVIFIFHYQFLDRFPF